jgi:hypothetical protein
MLVKRGIRVRRIGGDIFSLLRDRCRLGLVWSMPSASWSAVVSLLLCMLLLRYAI